MLDSRLRDLYRAASTHAAMYSDGGDHTVAAAVLTEAGETVLGLNAYHFLGGPCGEITALANHAASCPRDPVVAVVAVNGPTGEVIPPCGKCRQVIFDTDPAIQCIVRTSNGLEAQPVSGLLPHAYDWRAGEETQRVYMWEGYEQAIRDGSKRQTIRVDDPFRAGPAQIVFEKDTGSDSIRPVIISSVVSTRRGNLTEEHAIRDGFSSLEELHEALNRHYPGLRTDDPVDIVTFYLP